MQFCACYKRNLSLMLRATCTSGSCDESVELSVSDLFRAFAGSSDILDGQSRGVGGENTVWRDHLRERDKKVNSIRHKANDQDMRVGKSFKDRERRRGLKDPAG